MFELFCLGSFATEGVAEAVELKRRERGTEADGALWTEEGSFTKSEAIGGEMQLSGGGCDVLAEDIGQHKGCDSEDTSWSSPEAEEMSSQRPRCCPTWL